MVIEESREGLVTVLVIRAPHRGPRDTVASEERIQRESINMRRTSGNNASPQRMMILCEAVVTPGMQQDIIVDGLEQ